MKETTKTIAFISVAVGMVLLAGLQYWLSQPKLMADFGDIGKPFYESFTDAQQAKSLEVYALDPDSVELQQFRVEFNDGLWRIPSHYNYPAEAADRLAETAVSVMGLTRESLAGRLESDHERLGVVDPRGDKSRDPQTVGKRLTLKDSDGNVLVDFIIGKEAGDVEVPETQRPIAGEPTEKYYYVRLPDEMPTYKVKLNVDLSTRFADWIQPDLLQLQGSALKRIDVDNYQLRELAADPLGQVKRLSKAQGDQLTLTREGGFGPWKLLGLDEEREEVDNARANQIANTLEEMKIVGVRPKFKFNGQSLLTSDLQLNRIQELEQNPNEFNRAIMQLQMELSDKGFNLAPVAPNSQELMLVSHHGQLSAGADNGVRYTLNVGKPISGDEKTIEIGGSSTENQPAEDKAQDESATANHNQDQNADGSEQGTDPADGAADGNANDKDAESKNRFVMIRVAFDQSLLGEKPTEPEKPVKPVEPEGYQPPPEIKDRPESGDQANPANQESGDQSKENTQSNTTDSPDTQAPAAENQSTEVAPTNPLQPAQDQPRKPEFVEYDQKLKEYEQAETQYQLNLTRYQDEMKQYEEKSNNGKKRVDELNERIGDWYYVVSAENLKSLQVTQRELIKPKKPGPTELPPKPDITFPDDSGQLENADPANEAGSGNQPVDSGSQ